MVNICSKCGIDLGLNFNAKKSKCIAIGPTVAGSLATMIINNLPLQWVDKIITLVFGSALGSFFALILQNLVVNLLLVLMLCLVI